MDEEYIDIKFLADKLASMLTAVDSKAASALPRFLTDEEIVLLKGLLEKNGLTVEASQFDLQGCPYNVEVRLVD